MDAIRLKPHSPGDFENCLGKIDEALGIIRVVSLGGAVEFGPIIVGVIGQKINGNPLPQFGLVKGGVDQPVRNGEGKPIQSLGLREASSIDHGILGQDHSHLMP
jgi:hypothetical protein